MSPQDVKFIIEIQIELWPSNAPQAASGLHGEVGSTRRGTGGVTGSRKVLSGRMYVPL